MNWNFHIRSVIRTSVCVAVALVALTSFAAPVNRPQVQAQLLDHAEFLCANCFFAPSDYYFCFAADNKVLIAYQSTPVLNWRDKSKNYLTKFRSEWGTWTAPGQTVPISYDDKHIWVHRADGKEVRLKRSNKADIFLNSQQCRSAH